MFSGCAWRCAAGEFARDVITRRHNKNAWHEYFYDATGSGCSKPSYTEFSPIVLETELPGESRLSPPGSRSATALIEFGG
jgi:hypothetical protein